MARAVLKYWLVGVDVSNTHGRCWRPLVLALGLVLRHGRGAK